MSSTSRYAPAWRALFRILQEETVWPDGFDPRVGVLFAGYDPNRPAPLEVVVVLGEAEEDQDWATIGQRARDDRLQTSLYVETAIPNRTAMQALDRLESFTVTIENKLRATVIPANRPVELVDTFLWWEVVRVLPDIAPLKGGGGYGGRATVVVGLKSRI